MTSECSCYAVDQNGKIVISEHENKQFNPASLTKLMVLYIVFRDLPLNKFLEVPESAVVKNETGRTPQSNMNLKAGQKVAVLDLVLGMIVASANDAANTIAYFYGTEKFVDLLNSEARKLGLFATVFRSPSGIGQGTTTGADMACLAKAIWEEFPAYRSFFSIGTFNFNGKRYKNTNQMLFKDSRVIGLKTGTTGHLRRNLITIFQQDGTTLFIVVLNAKDKQERDDVTARALRDAAAKLKLECETDSLGGSPISPKRKSGKWMANLLKTLQKLRAG
jgi:D-alanyl-D-alanine carboxypeptidase (penicillin-binding protein 5/6)